MSRRAAEPLYLTEGEIAARLGVSAAEWRAIAEALEKAGLPRRDPVFSGRRYWPSVKAFLDRRNGLLHGSTPIARDGEEHLGDYRGRNTRARA